MILIDDFSCKCWIYFIKKGDQTFSKFCELKALVEKESGKKIRALRSDNGGEYVSQEFNDFCGEEGIKRELTEPHNPWQNGVAERNNRIIVGETQAMLHDQGLPLHFWADACNTTVYLQNRSPHHILGMKSLDEAILGKRPDVVHFRIVGSSAYFHVTKDAWKKLEPISKLVILVGCTDTPHNYRVYFPTSRRTVVCRDLKFDEQKAMRASLEREIQLQAMEELFVPKEEEPQTDAEHPHLEVPGVETSTQADSSRDGNKYTREADRLFSYARENVGEPSSQCRQRRSPDRYIGYMALVGECVETEPSSFGEAVQQLIWVGAMVEECDSIVRNNVWDVVPRPKNKSVVSSH